LKSEEFPAVFLRRIKNKEYPDFAGKKRYKKYEISEEKEIGMHPWIEMKAI
jgi:hypothetical protein